MREIYNIKNVAKAVTFVFVVSLITTILSMGTAYLMVKASEETMSTYLVDTCTSESIGIEDDALYNNINPYFDMNEVKVGPDTMRLINDRNMRAYIIEKPKTFDIKMTFAGDCMVATYKGDVYAGSFSSKALEGDWEYFFDGVDEYFESDDFTVVNLENVLTDDSTLKPVWKDHSPAYWYKAPTENTKVLTSQSVEIANLANNHFGDYGTKGRTDTIKACEDAGLIWGNNDRTVYVEKNGYKIAMIFHGLWAEWQANNIIKRLDEAEKNSDFQVVFYHGGKERIHAPEEWKKRASHKIVDAGADLVIGNHPHVLQPMETYNGVPIIYSMGNFLFGGSNRPENRTILYTYKMTLDCETFEVKDVETEVIPCYVYTGKTNNWRPEIITDEAQKQKVLDFMNWKVNSPL